MEVDFLAMIVADETVAGLGKKFDNFPYLLSQGAGVCLSTLTDVAASLVVMNKPWLIEDSNSFHWVIDLMDPSLPKTCFPEVDLREINLALSDGWRMGHA